MLVINDSWIGMPAEMHSRNPCLTFHLLNNFPIPDADVDERSRSLTSSGGDRREAGGC